MKEKKTVFKLFFVWDFEKEERWLNEMAQEGWALTCGGFCTYTFEKCEPGEYIIRVETLDNSSDFENFMEELGAESVGRCFRWGYFRRKSELGEFDMFSDIDSRIAHLDKIGKTLFLLCMANIVIGLANCTGSDFAHAPAPHLAFLDQFGDGSRYIFNGNPGIKAVLVE